MKFSIQEIKAAAHEGPISIQQTIDASELEQIPSIDIRKIGDVLVEGIITVEKNEIVFSFSMVGNMILPCARTLVDVDYPFHFRATEIFTNVYSEAEEDEDVHYVAEDEIDLRPFVYENIILQMPYRVFSDEEMIEEGEGWSFFTEEELTEKKADQMDPRLEKLQQFLDRNNK